MLYYIWTGSACVYGAWGGRVEGTAKDTVSQHFLGLVQLPIPYIKSDKG